MPKRKSALGQSGLIQCRRSERLQGKDIKKYQYGTCSEESENKFCSVARTPPSRCHGEHKTKKITYTIRGSFPIVNKDVIAQNLGNENQETKYFSNTTLKVGTSEPSYTSKEKCNVKIPEEMPHPIWRGSLNIYNDDFGKVDGLAACKSIKASSEIFKVLCNFPTSLPSQVLPRLDVWPESFSTSPPIDDIIDLYMFPENESNEKAFSSLLDYLTGQDLCIRIVLDETKLLVFSSRLLPHQYWRTFDKYYLWAVFIGTNAFFPYDQEEDRNSIHNNESAVPFNLATDVDSVIKPERKNLKNWVAQDSCKERNQRLDERLNSSGSAIFEGLSIKETCTTTAEGSLGTKIPSDPILREVDASKICTKGENLQRVPESLNGSEAPQKITIDTGITPPFLGSNEAFIPNIADETFPSTDNIDQEYIQRNASSSATYRQSFVNEPMKNTAFQGHNKGNMSYSAAKSICTSVLNMAHHFDDEIFDEITSADKSGELVLSRYHVKRSLAPTLHAIIEKHGDIAETFPTASSKMLSSVLESICEVVEDFQALEIKNLRPHHLNTLQSVIRDAELVNVNVKWLQSLHDELREMVNQIKPYEYKKISRKEKMDEVEYMKRTLDLKKTKLMKLQSQVQSLETHILSLNADIKRLDDEIGRAKSIYEGFKFNSLMDGLL